MPKYELSGVDRWDVCIIGHESKHNLHEAGSDRFGKMVICVDDVHKGTAPIYHVTEDRPSQIAGSAVEDSTACYMAHLYLVASGLKAEQHA